ncbi:unnamed protein product [Trichobilharzia regenti]|nr:unnamed protein product [Trichobilharzia regenti]
MRFQTTAYHPQANATIERLHRQLKAGLSAANNAHWTGSLSLVLLGIRNVLKTDAGCTTAELVYGTILRLPGLEEVTSTAKATEPSVETSKKMRSGFNRKASNQASSSFGTPSRDVRARSLANLASDLVHDLVRNISRNLDNQSRCFALSLVHEKRVL